MIRSNGLVTDRSNCSNTTFKSTGLHERTTSGRIASAVSRDGRELAEVESERQACRSHCQMNASIEPLREAMARTRAAIARHSSLRFRRGPARDANAREPPD